MTILILSLVFYYWNNGLEAFVSDLRTFESLHQPRGGLVLERYFSYFLVSFCIYRNPTSADLQI